MHNRCGGRSPGNPLAANRRSLSVRAIKLRHSSAGSPPPVCAAAEPHEERKYTVRGVVVRRRFGATAKSDAIPKAAAWSITHCSR